jgi:hypothetical protein
MARRRCRNCPETPKPEPTTPKTMTLAAGEGEKLWHQALFACNSVVEMMAGYAMLGVAGDPVRPLRKLAGRINEILKTCESRETDELPTVEI